ncbi:cutinase family protein [Antrihabitans stalactiti]|uniref:Cutinase family protein n=1 Tax=Antrihabitans stalactiti TaxID=2584121 RepID=A0A848KK11_9NOCA|nr:cutinase family protein [Antrihabitans stalactiti]NMN98599.1 cutinase family protein [Antrihabitans stalactiti]
MTSRGTRKRSRGKLLIVLLALVLAALLALLLWYQLAGRLKLPGPGPTEPARPKSQSAACPDVQVVAVPGTWESNTNDDLHNPTANPNALMLNVTRPLQAQFPTERLDVVTVPYVAQFSNPIAFPPDGQQSYNNSRSEGTQKATDILVGMHTNCPLTSFILTGFSQGAVIAGDLASQIGAGKGPVPADLVLGVTLIADGRRDTGQGIPIGPDPSGVGAEVALRGLEVPGIKMTGPRPGGFGTLADHVYSICTPGDLICAAPAAALNPLNMIPSAAALANAAGNPVHQLYNGFQVDDSGTTAPQWTANWAAGLVESAPHPAHT